MSKGGTCDTGGNLTKHALNHGHTSHLGMLPFSGWWVSECADSPALLRVVANERESPVDRTVVGFDREDRHDLLLTCGFSRQGVLRRKQELNMLGRSLGNKTLKLLSSNLQDFAAALQFATERGLPAAVLEDLQRRNQVA